MRRARTQYLSIGAAVLALHAVVVWLLMSKIRVLAVPETAQSLELFWIPTPPRPVPEPAERNPIPGSSLPSNRSAPSRPPAPQAVPAPPPSNAITPPVDWQAELARQAQAAASPKPEPRFREFDFPRRPPPAGKLPEFAWDRNHTHRVETDSGALLVHINDNCAVVLAPLPFLFCHPGRRPANGDLFEHMRDSLPLAPGSPGAR